MATIRRFFNKQFARWEFETVPEVIPSTTEQPETADLHLLELHLVNNDGSNQHVINVTDGNGVSVLPTNLDVSAKSIFEYVSTGRLCVGGLRWSSDDGASTVGYARWFI